MNALVRNWWILALRGLFAVIFGVLALVWPGLTLATLVILFGAYALADGVFALIAAVQRRGQVWALVLEGIAGIAAGIIAFLFPGITALALLYLIAGWAVVTGVLELIAAGRLRQTVTGEVLLIVAGLCSIAFGILLALRPAAGALALVWLIGAYALVFGIVMIALGFRLHAHAHPSAKRTPDLTGIPGGKAVEPPTGPTGLRESEGFSR